MSLMLWRAWLGPGRTISSADTSWEQLPRRVVGVVDYHEPPFRTIHAGEWHWIGEGRVHSLPGRRPGEYTPPPPGVPEELLKQGFTLPDDEWDQVNREMWESREWP